MTDQKKKIIQRIHIVLLVNLLVLSAAGCSSADSNEDLAQEVTGDEVQTQEPSENSESEEKESLGEDGSQETEEEPSEAVGTLYEQRVDQQLDLNGDGEAETIYYDSNEDTGELTLRINEVDYSDWLNENYCAIYPEHDYFYIVDLDASDSYLELGFVDYGPSSDELTNFVRYDGTELVGVGTVPGYPVEYCEKGDSFTESTSFTANGDGTITTNYYRLGTLQTWYAMVNYQIGSDGILELVEQDIYYPFETPVVSSDGNNTEYPITLNCDLPVYQDNSDVTAVTTKITPQQVRFTATDDKNWCYVEAEDGSAGWFYYTGYGQIEVLDKDVMDVFDGLYQAD